MNREGLSDIRKKYDVSFNVCETPETIGRLVRVRDHGIAVADECTFLSVQLRPSTQTISPFPLLLSNACHAG